MTNFEAFFVKLTNFFRLGGSANLTEGSAEQARPKLTKDSAEPARFGRSLVEIVGLKDKIVIALDKR